MIKFLYTNIGRGHPFYLDGIVELLKQAGRLNFECHDVFEISKDPALLAWRMARWLYKIGSTDSIVGTWYNSIRNKSAYNPNSLALRIMGRDLRKWFLTDDTPLVVDHPVLAGILQGKKNLIYQHGEIAVPPQAAVRGADHVFVPIEASAEPFLNAGYRKDQIIVSGLCIESALVRQSQQAFENRLTNIRGGQPLTGSFFSSGAEPAAHVEKLILAAKAVAQSDGKAIVFAQDKAKLASELVKYLQADSRRIVLNSYKSREQLDSLTAEFFNLFDYLVTPSHERTNWALGLGLPMFILEPLIGPFAPLNRAALLDAGVAVSLDSTRDASEFAQMLAGLRKSGKLAKMAESGWQKHPINGFQTIADFLINKYASRA